VLALSSDVERNSSSSHFVKHNNNSSSCYLNVILFTAVSSLVILISYFFSPSSSHIVSLSLSFPLVFIHSTNLIHSSIDTSTKRDGSSSNSKNGRSSNASVKKRKKFACKCVKILNSQQKQIVKLHEEVNILREVRGHPFIIQLHEVFCVDNELLIITDLGRGGDLFGLLTSNPRFGVTEKYAVKTMLEMLSAINFIHDRGICHRDLKLENWVLLKKDPWGPLKLIGK
jgi:hypothetical protein